MLILTLPHFTLSRIKLPIGYLKNNCVYWTEATSRRALMIGYVHWRAAGRL
jgi:hypothetical protein